MWGEGEGGRGKKVILELSRQGERVAAANTNIAQLWLIYLHTSHPAA